MLPKLESAKNRLLIVDIPFRLKFLDIEFMKQLHDRVNIIPVIAKADTMTPEELTSFKQRVSKSTSGC